MKPKPEYYRAQAERCRDLAKRTPNWDVKQTLLDVAADYENLAKEAERKR